MERERKLLRYLSWAVVVALVLVVAYGLATNGLAGGGSASAAEAISSTGSGTLGAFKLLCLFH